MMPKIIFQQPVKKIKNKITNKNVKAVINRGVDDYVVNIRVELIGERFY